MLILFVFSELNFDRFHPDVERIYRVTTKVYSRDGQVLYLPTCLGWTPEEIHEKGFSDVITCRVYRNQISSNYINNWMEPIRFFYADPSFFKVFGFNLLAGNSDAILDEPNTVVITESMARKYFKDEDPVDQKIEIYKNFYIVKCN